MRISLSLRPVKPYSELPRPVARGKPVIKPEVGIRKFNFFYGWVIVAASGLILAVHAGTMYSFGVFFKPMATEFGWGRGATSGVYATFSIVQGLGGLALGWLADRFGPAKVMAFCGFIAGLGLTMSSRISTLGQLHLTYGVIASIGLGGPFAISVSTTARWFQKRRGLALGLVSSGIGAGTLIFVPIVERLIAAFGWSKTYLLLGATWGTVIAGVALCLRKDPESIGQAPYGAASLIRLSAVNAAVVTESVAPAAGMQLNEALHSRALWILLMVYFLFNFCLQMVMVHLVNYATDLYISPLIAATFISVIGVGSIAGRLIMGAVSDRIGSHNALIICCAVLVVSLVQLIFAGEIWMFYLFAAVFGFAYGGEVPQMAALVGSFFGLQAVAALVGVIVLGTRIGGALGSYLGGAIFDATASYRLAFAIAAAASLAGIAAAVAVGRNLKIATA